MPAAYYGGVPGITWTNILNNWLFAGIGNLVGAAVFVAAAYYYIHLKDADPPGSGGPQAGARGSEFAAAD